MHVNSFPKIDIKIAEKYLGKTKLDFTESYKHVSRCVGYFLTFRIC